MCLFGTVWYDLVKELDICEGDVIALYMAEDQTEDVYIVVFNKNDVKAEKKPGTI